MKKTKIRQIIEENVIQKILPKFNSHGFKYRKVDQSFIKIDGIFQHIVNIHYDYSIYMDEKLDRPYDLYLCFNIIFETEIPEFENWYNENFSGQDMARIGTFHKSAEYCLPLKEGKDFKIPEDFDKNQQTYIGDSMYLEETLKDAYRFSDFGHDKIVQNFDANIDSVFLILSEQLNFEYDFEKLALENEKLMKNFAILIFLKQFELPRNHITKLANERISQLESKSVDPKEKLMLSESLDYFILIGEKFLNLTISNPYKEKYKRGLKVLTNKNECISIGNDFTYSEIYRIDYSNINEFKFVLNGDGSLFIYLEAKNQTQKNRFHIFNSEGNCIVEKEMSIKSQYLNGIGIVKNTNDFFISNHVINKVTGDIQMLNFNEKKSFRIKDITETAATRIVTLTSKVIFYQNDLFIKEIKAIKNTSIVHHDLRNKRIYCMNKKMTIHVMDYTGSIINKFIIQKGAIYPPFFQDNFVYSIGISNMKLEKLDIDNGVKINVQKDIPYSNTLVELKENCNLIVYNKIDQGSTIDIFDRGFKNKKGQFKSSCLTDFIPLINNTHMVKNDTKMKNLIILKNATANTQYTP